MVKPYFLYIIIAFLSLSGVNAQKNKLLSKKIIEQKIDSIFSDFNDLNKPGAAVAVTYKGKIAFKKGYGSANLEYGIPITPNTIFNIASVSKQFTVFAILLLAEQGKLSLDDDIHKYVPEVPDFKNPITLRHLASHISGLRDQWYLLGMAGWRDEDLKNNDDILRLVSHQKELNFDPETDCQYSNTGFTLLAEVVSRVSNQSFAKFTKSHIFIPLQMLNTQFVDDIEKPIKNIAYSYHIDSTGYKKSTFNNSCVGPTNLYTTVEDMSSWAMNFSSLKVGSENLIKEMNTPAKLRNGKIVDAALGQFIDNYKGLKEIYHEGLDAGYRTYFSRFPDQNFSIIVITNSISSNPNYLAKQVTNLYLKDDFTEAINSSSLEKINSIQLNNNQLTKFTGHYWNNKKLNSRTIYIKNDTLRYSRSENNESPLIPIEKNKFQMLGSQKDLKVVFANKQMTVIIDEQDSTTLKFYEPKTYSIDELKEYAGTYYSEELQTYYTFIPKENKLELNNIRIGTIDFFPIKKDFFQDQGKWEYSSFEFVRDNDSKIKGVRFSSFGAERIKNLWFKKVR